MPNPDPTPPAWFLEALALAAGLKPGSVSTLQVVHDDGCPQLSGGRCCCSPDYKLVTIDPHAEQKR
ncbi:MAG: hypothetical protein ACKODX_01100 [Gemmata sp.]